MSRASDPAATGARWRIGWSITYLLELWLSLRHLDGRFGLSFVRGSSSRKAVEIVYLIATLAQMSRADKDSHKLRDASEVVDLTPITAKSARGN